MEQYSNRARQLMMDGRLFRDINEAIKLYNDYVEECEKFGTSEENEDYITELSQKLRAMKIIINCDLDIIIDNLPEIEAKFILEFYYKNHSLTEVCRTLKVTQTQGEEIQKKALEHFDAVKRKEKK